MIDSMSLVNGSTHHDSIFQWPVRAPGRRLGGHHFELMLEQRFLRCPHGLKIYIILFFLSLYIYHLLCVTTPISPITFG